MFVYRGYTGPGGGGKVVEFRDSNDPNWSPLPLRLDIRNHSPDGFNWGYGGSGPAQLALALLAHACDTSDVEPALYQAFKWEVISRLGGDSWEMSQERVLGWVLAYRAAQAAGE